MSHLNYAMMTHAIHALLAASTVFAVAEDLWGADVWIVTLFRQDPGKVTQELLLGLAVFVFKLGLNKDKQKKK